MQLKLQPNETPFNLGHTVQCGQLFRWQQQGESWLGVVEGRILKVRQRMNTLEFEGADPDYVRSYFRLDDDFTRILLEINKDPLMNRAIQQLRGLRLVRQNPWECLVSFVCATYKSIPAIMSMIASLSKTFGQQLAFGDSIFFEFPKPSALAEASLGDLRRCGLGFRAKRVREVARIVSNGELDFQMMKKLDYEKTKRILLKLPGVGNKVADCIMLFSLEKLEAFPVDIWMKRVMQRYYANNFDDSFIEMVSEKKSLSFKEYNAISHFARGYFERFAGYAQQYLYHFIRGDSGSKR